MTSKSVAKRIKVQKGKKAWPTQVHVLKNKKMEPADKFKGEVFDDWFEQQKAESIGDMKDD